jgi:hypothetical protein
MASAKRTPKVSRISRDRTVAYARRKKPTAEGEPDGPDDDAPETTSDTAASEGAAETPPAPVASVTSVIPPPPSVETPEAPPKPAGARAQIDTVMMPAQASIGTPPAMPANVPPVRAPADVTAPENPAHMPGPREIPGGNPDDPAAPPGFVPSGDSRSMRRRTDRYEFVLVYRIQTFVISRTGEVGKRGQWRVVEYPTPASASHAYAKECSRFVSEGFSDYRE